MRKLLNRRTIGSGSALALLVAFGVSALPSTPVAAKPAAAQPTSFSITVNPQKVTSSSHTKLTVQINASKFSQGGSGTSSSASFSLSAKGAPDSHNWGFPLSGHSVSYNTGTGKGTIKTGRQAKPYGLIKTTVKKHGKPNVTKCHTYKSVSQPVVLHGKWGFNTHSKGKHKWGKAVRSGKFKGTVYYSIGQFQQCGPAFRIPCFKGVSWSAFHPFGSSFNQVSLSGNVGFSIFASRSVSLAKPRNASRNDYVMLTNKHQKFSVRHGKATVKVGSGPGASGSATLKSPQAGNQGTPQACGRGHTETNTSWQASYKNGSKPLTVKEQIEGPLKLPNIAATSSEASINKSKVHQ